MWELIREILRGLQGEGVAKIRIFSQEQERETQEWWWLPTSMIRPYVHLKWMIKEELKRMQYLLLLGQDQLERHYPVHEDTEWAEKEKSLLRVGQIVMYTGGSSNSTLGMNNEEKNGLD